MTVLHRTEIGSILEYLEEQTEKAHQHELFLQYCSEVQSFRKFLIFYFTQVKGKFDNEQIGDVPYNMPDSHSPAFSSIERNMTRIEAIVAPKTSLADRRALKLSVFSGLSTNEILLMENVFDSKLEEYYDVDWKFFKSILKV